MVIGVLMIFTPIAAAAVLTYNDGAGSATESETFSGTPNFDQVLTFNEFDEQSGNRTLTDIQVLLSFSSIGGSLILDNDSGDPASGTFEFGAKGDISSVEVSLIDAGFQPVVSEISAVYSDGFSLDPNTGDGSNDFDPTPPDGMQYDAGTQSGNDGGYLAAGVFSQYLGTSTFDVTADAIQWSDFGSVSGIEYAVSPSTASGTVTFNYFYDYTGQPIPEPATMLLFGTGLIGVAGVGRRRFFGKK